MAYSPELIYKGNQVIVASGRIVFNAKDDAVLIFAKKTIGFSSAGSIHFNSDDMMVVNSPKIYLGLDAKENLVKGKKLKKYLSDLNSVLIKVANALSTATGLPHAVPMLQVNTAAQELLRVTQELQSQIDQILSKDNFTN